MQYEYVPSSDGDAVSSLFDAFISSVGPSEPNEIKSVVLGLSESTRERLAWFCLSRDHLKDIGRQIAATCFDLDPPDFEVFPADEMKARSRAEWAFHYD
jgi:hypothetical protein